MGSSGIMIQPRPHIILFDGFCNLCNSSVQFIIKRDRKAIFSFAPLQGDQANTLLKNQNLDHSKMDSIIYIQNGMVFTKSTAALKISKKLNALWPLLYAFIIIPKPLRDAIYDWIARNRYQWFGKREECTLPKDHWKSRFL